MRRADRLFRIVQLLRRRRVVTAAWLAEELEISTRTVYRDIRDLSLAGVPITGEAGVGYALPRGFDLPPLMFTEGEMEALVLGARIVQSWSDPTLAASARAAIAKVEAVLPDRLKARIESAALFAPGFHVASEMTANLSPLRTAIAEQRKLRFAYTGKDGRMTRRTVCPLGLAFWGSAWTLVAWCELRQGYRNFRLDRITRLRLLNRVFQSEPDKSLQGFFAAVSTKA